MNTKGMNIVLPLLLVAAVIIGFAWQKQTPRHALPANTQYYFDFYPRANIYFNVSDSVYYYRDLTGKWQTAQTLPASMEQTLDRKVRLQGNTKEIWKNNDQHRMQYAIQLYAAPADFKEDPVVAPPPPPPPVTEKQMTDPKAEPQPKEKGLKHFFSRLFRKDKKDT